MKRNLVVTLLSALVMAPPAQAEGPYAGLMYGLVDSEAYETDNLGLVIGYLAESGFGFDFYYSETVSEDSVSASGISADISLDTWGLFATYQTPGDFYLKGKLGYAIVTLDFDFEDIRDADDSESGLAYGVAGGMVFGDGAFEISYTVLPEYEEFRGNDVEDDVDMIAIRYQWNL